MTNLREAFETLADEWEAAGYVTLYETPAEMAQVIRELLAKHPAPTADRDEVAREADQAICDHAGVHDLSDDETHAIADALLARFEMRRKA